jgi:hypothetical protein
VAHGRLTAALVALLGCGACNNGGPTAPRAAPPPPRTTAAPSAPEPFPAAADEPPYKRVLSKRQQLSIPLPGRSGWTLRRDPGTFLVLEHPGTSSLLLVAHWRESENMSAARCEERARLLRDLPERGRALDARTLHVPDGFDTTLDTGFSGSEGELDAYALAFGAEARRCFAFVFTTRATGPEAERLAGDRLAVITGITLEGIEHVSDIVEPARQ